MLDFTFNSHEGEKLNSHHGLVGTIAPAYLIQVQQIIRFLKLPELSIFKPISRGVLSYATL